jgi:homoserine O-acetyltransferase
MLRAATAVAQQPGAFEADFTLKDFTVASGEALSELRLHYRTLGGIRRDGQGVVRNAVLILHGTGGSGEQFLRPEFAGELYGRGRLLDTTRYFIVLPDGIGHGRSSKPSDGLHARFPRYGYRDMIEAQYRLLTEGLGVSHLRLGMGTSMGGMHTWLWGGLQGVHGRAHAAGEFADADLRSEPGVAPADQRRDPERPGLAGR